MGSSEVTPLDLASGFAIFANGGFQIEPYFIDHIEDMNGNVIFSANPLTVCHQCPPEILALENKTSSDNVNSNLRIFMNNEDNIPITTTKVNKVFEIESFG